ncbi:extracellular solute-binding protein [Melioribacteraceae bacterium 4301-Me]|uniref:extracellular solute-binding protein n=1 Tax=Pyranulibacter aquaticus TaxID=3163344 RepID=UPI00359AA423
MKSIRLISFIFSFMILVSCSSKVEKRRDEIIYWSSNNTEEIEFAKYVVNKWNQINKNQKVKFQPVPEGQSSEEVILAAVVGKTTPDIYSNMWEGDVESYARAGVLVALDTLEGFMNFLYERCDSSVIKEVTSPDGHIYQIPWKINPVMMIYNVNEFRNLGFLEPPKTYSEFLEAAKKFQRDVNGDGYVDRWIGYAEVVVTWWQRLFDFYPLYLAASNGAPLVKNNKAVFNNEAAKKVFDFLRKLYKNNYFPKERLSVRQDVFLDGIIATRFTGPWEIPHTEKFKPEGFNYNFTNMLVPDNHEGPVYTYGDPKNIVIFKKCPNPNLALRFLMFALDEENDLKFLEITNQLPHRKNLDTNPKYLSYFSRNPKMKIFASEVKYVKGTDQSPQLREVFDLISQEYEACVIYGKKTPEEALNDAEKAVNLLFIK